MQAEWSEEEFAAAVAAYLGMAEDHAAGRPVKRADVRRGLIAGPLAARSEAAIEYRMQNISAVLELQGRPHLPGYLPARNVGVRGTRIISSLIAEALEPPTKADEEGFDEAYDPLGSRVFVTGMWGFNSAREGYVGFTSERTRDRLISLHQPGDLMLIVGQRGAFSDERDVGRLLGIVELAPVPILEPERMSEEAYRAKVERHGAERWRFALPIKRSWVMGREVKARALLPVSYAHKYARSVGASFRQLTPEETERVLALPVRPVSIWGEPEWAPDKVDQRFEQSIEAATRRGPRPTFGQRSSDHTDGETKLYLMELLGCIDQLFSKLQPHQAQKIVIKVGRTNDLKRRLKELNCGFPSAADVRWSLVQAQTFDTAGQAHAAEQQLLTDLERRGCSLGKEFAVIPKRERETLLAAYAGRSAFHIKA